MKVIQLPVLANPSYAGGEIDLIDLEEEMETESCVKIHLELDLDQMEVE